GRRSSSARREASTPATSATSPRGCATASASKAVRHRRSSSRREASRGSAPASAIRETGFPLSRERAGESSRRNLRLIAIVFGEVSEGGLAELAAVAFAALRHLDDALRQDLAGAAFEGRPGKARAGLFQLFPGVLIRPAEDFDGL